MDRAAIVNVANGAPRPALRLYQPGEPTIALGLAVSHLMTRAAFARLRFGEWSRILVGQINRRHYRFVLDDKDRSSDFSAGPSRRGRPLRRGSKGAQVLHMTPPKTANALSSTPGRQIPPRSTVSCSTRPAEPCSARKQPTSSGCTRMEEHVLSGSTSMNSSPITFRGRRPGWPLHPGLQRG